MCPTHHSRDAVSASVHRVVLLAVLVAAVCSQAGCVTSLVNPYKPENAALGEDDHVRVACIRRTLSAFHDAASRADERAYFELLADDAVFLGTDGSERWTKAEFQAYAHPYFAQSKGWTYKATKTQITINGDIAWFDQDLSNEKWGPCRGSGVLRRELSRDRAFKGYVWRITQYNLSVPIPNDLMPEVSQRIRAFSK
jgi:hypothetical protein